MQELTSSITSIKNSGSLKGTQWRCTTHIEEGIEFHEMRFVSPSQVEGWSKDRSQEKADHMFTASYTLRGETLSIQQEQESFQAARIQQKIIAFVDGKTMIFHQVL
jgi:hypothetical protein